MADNLHIFALPTSFSNFNYKSVFLKTNFKLLSDLKRMLALSKTLLIIETLCYPLSVCRSPILQWVFIHLGIGDFYSKTLKVTNNVNYK